ncbi:peroxisomal 2,4-dienoyl-CoA reductase-like [Canna indica]|uniref:2,4-dienoyl-CoA reductase [(3E)-enoyl-CoA-producing] n=1 Tax=Canna indica TaxID=4628 RepID=A0AAQ3KFW2_9LILI|nr:peroxisomal 2,4-dienoyl-CoA reductase-like [Canna indica]
MTTPKAWGRLTRRWKAWRIGLGRAWCPPSLPLLSALLVSTSISTAVDEEAEEAKEAKDLPLMRTKFVDKVIGRLKDDGDFDSLRLKIIRKVKENSLRLILLAHTLCHEALKYLKKGEGKGPTKGGLILNISATLHYTATWYQIYVSAAKAAVDNITWSSALEWGTDYAIWVNGIAPGPIGDTPGMRKLACTRRNAEQL